ncbi:hypothetical protein KSZ_34270 [Dictyobacter formicarum]|uniref:Uncharacterized protein n=1 Tax=Dictyobacter formicarum TaxID=2778368 RepID=A0ABQ3VIX0_9CHLR|nr:hypothetical protein KSZ_34270 [Dictyobacter formicarum]
MATTRTATATTASFGSWCVVECIIFASATGSCENGEQATNFFAMAFHTYNVVSMFMADKELKSGFAV